jgi:hypothetical protein
VVDKLASLRGRKLAELEASLDADEDELPSDRTLALAGEAAGLVASEGLDAAVLPTCLRDVATPSRSAAAARFVWSLEERCLATLFPVAANDGSVKVAPGLGNMLTVRAMREPKVDFRIHCWRARWERMLRERDAIRERTGNPEAEHPERRTLASYLLGDEKAFSALRDPWPEWWAELNELRMSGVRPSSWMKDALPKWRAAS